MRTALVLFLLLILIYVLFSGRLRSVFQAVTGPAASSGAVRPNIPGASPGQSGTGGIGAIWRRITR